MKKIILSSAVISTMLLAAGCSTSGGGVTTGMINEFKNILVDTVPFVNESKEWEAYSINAIQQGVVYSKGNAADLQFVSKKMDAEYAAAIDRLASPFARGAKAKQELNEANQNYRFKYHNVRVVKDKKTSNLLGYCVHYDRTQLDNPKKLENEYIYVTKDKPVSAATAHEDFVPRMCGKDFYIK